MKTFLSLLGPVGFSLALGALPIAQYMATFFGTISY